MLTKKFVLTVLAASFLFGGVTLRAQDAGALLDLLVRKRIITEKEAQSLRADLSKESAPVPVSVNSGDKWKLSTPITEIELYGDARVRYEYRAGETDNGLAKPRPSPGVGGPNDWQERQRERYRLRIGLRGTLADDWFFGVRLETSSNPRSTNVTFGDDTSGNGPFAKNSDGIAVGQAYLGYRGFKDITLTAGKMANPLVTTLMTWDADINPEGAAEQWKHSFNLEFGGGNTAAAAESFSKDGKGVAIAPNSSEPFKLKIEVFANFAQFVYDDANPENPLGPRATTTANGGNQLIPNTDAFLLAWQVGAKFTFPKTLYAQIAPTIYNYTGNGDTFNAHFRGGDPNISNSSSLSQNQNGINSLLIFDLPWEIGWKLGDLPMRIFGDFAVNLEGNDRARAALHPNKGDQRYAYQVGFGVGQLKVKRDWQINVFWQHTEQYSLDPNLVDSDIFDSRVNMEGIAVQAGYALSDAVAINLTYAYGWPSDSSLGTGGTGDIGINPLAHYQVFQADLNVKF